MTLANYCIIVAAVLPILCAAMAKSKGFGKRVREGGFDNRDPRGWLSRQEGWQARANAAQANAFEGLPLFIAGVLAAQQMHLDQTRIDQLAIAYIVLRLVYTALYLANQPSLRSLAWILSMGVSVGLFFA